MPLTSLAGKRRVQLGFHSNVAKDEFVAIDNVSLINTTTGINQAIAAKGNIRVANGQITVSGMAGQTLHVVSPDGRILLKQVVTSDNETVSLSYQGVCFVICGGHSAKVVNK